MLEIRITVEELDYSKVVAKVLPMALESAGKNEDASHLLHFAAKAEGLTTAAAKAAIAMLPDSTKQHLAVTALNNHAEEIINLIEKLAKDNDIDVKLGKLTLTGTDRPKKSKKSHRFPKTDNSSK